MNSSIQTQAWAVVTGASGGIGEDIAKNLAAKGFNLLLTARNQSKLDALAQTWSGQFKVIVKTLAIDMSELDAADRIAAYLKQQAISPSILINNAGVGLYGLHQDTSLADEQSMIQLNIISLTRLTKLLLPTLLAKRGKILNVASTAAFQPGPYMAVYYATKAYVLSYTEALAQELKGTGVTVTALCPGPTRSGFQDKADMNASALVKNKKLPTAKQVADYAIETLFAGKVVAIHGAMNQILVQSLRMMPRSMVRQTVANLSKPT